MVSFIALTWCKIADELSISSYKYNDLPAAHKNIYHTGSKHCITRQNCITVQIFSIFLAQIELFTGDTSSDLHGCCINNNKKTTVYGDFKIKKHIT